MPGFVVYLYLYKNQAFASNPLIRLDSSEDAVTRVFRNVQLIPKFLRDKLR